MKKKLIIIWTLIELIAIASVLNMFIVIKSNNKDKPPALEVKPYTHKYIPLETVKCDLNKPEAKSIIDNIYKVEYICNEVDFIADYVMGYTQGKSILILNSLSITDYIIVLSHELTHVKYNTSNETFVEYTSIITLYEKGDDTFKKIALNRAKLIIAGCYKGTDYDCGYYLLEYFKNQL